MAEQDNRQQRRGPGGPGGGPGGPGRRGMPRAKVENPGKLFKRIMGYVFKYYSIHMVIIVICIFATVFSTIQGTLFTQTLIDEYIDPMVKSGSSDYGPLLHAIGRVACFYLIGVIAAFVQQFTMIYINQGTLKRLREDLFTHMESLPIKYFDTHSHGDIMSVYTNDIDTLRQMVSQSLPQLISSVVTIVSVLASMIALSLPLTGVTLVMVAVMLFCTVKITKISGSNFVAQQKNIGSLNGYIEEMITGQKVVKVFNHEQLAIEQFDELNEKLYESAYKANAYSGVIMPVNAQLGNVSYVICAMIGGVLALTGSSFMALTVGALASFLTFNKRF